MAKAQGARTGLRFDGDMGTEARLSTTSTGIAWLARGVFPPFFTPAFAAAIALPIGALGIVADLVESVIKRRANLKDSGAAIPGIGGMFDLSDSIILVAPVGYLLFRLP